MQPPQTHKCNAITSKNIYVETSRTQFLEKKKKCFKKKQGNCCVKESVQTCADEYLLLFSPSTMTHASFFS